MRFQSTDSRIECGNLMTCIDAIRFREELGGLGFELQDFGVVQTPGLDQFGHKLLHICLQGKLLGLLLQLPHQAQVLAQHLM